MLEYDARFLEAVEVGRADARRGDLLEHEEVVKSIEQVFREPRLRKAKEISSIETNRREIYRNSGRRPKGAYPNFSRKLLGERVGKGTDYISLILSGKREPRFELAMAMASAIGVTIEEFSEELKRRRALNTTKNPEQPTRKSAAG
jgi:transcriptional regulator with XRE-family HTH domain